MRTFIAILTVLLLVPVSARAQSSADTESVDAIITALYETISGPAGQERQWDRFRSLLAPEAQLIPIAVRPDSTFPSFNSVEGYIQRANPYFLKNGFFEVEIARKSEQFGTILHAFSTYESRNQADDPDPFSRGINSIQLMHDGNRWWIINIMWDSERPGLTIPDTYLPK